MKFLLLVLSLTISLFNNVIASCDINENELGASYEFSQETKGQHPRQVNHMNLWRHERQVAHEFTNTQITEVWQRKNKDKMQMVRYFDKYQQGIKYQPHEISAHNSTPSWELVWQLINPEFLAEKNLVETRYQGCNRMDVYTFTKDDKKITIEWLVHQKLLKAMHEETDAQLSSWELKNIILQPDRIKHAFIDRESYPTKNLNNIDDRNADPFLKKAFNQELAEHELQQRFFSQDLVLHMYHH